MSTPTITAAKTRSTQVTGASKPAAARPAAANRGATLLKTTLVAGSIVATLLGAHLAAQQDQSATGPVRTTARSGHSGFPASRALAALPNLPPITHLGTADTNALLNIPLAPIPSFSLPAPVTRSRSSR